MAFKILTKNVLKKCEDEVCISGKHYEKGISIYLRKCTPSVCVTIKAEFIP